MVCWSYCFSRVHVTAATLKYLNNDFQVEPGKGEDRSAYLRDHGITTYFIIPPPNRRKKVIFNSIQVYASSSFDAILVKLKLSGNHLKLFLYMYCAELLRTCTRYSKIS